MKSMENSVQRSLCFIRTLNSHLQNEYMKNHVHVRKIVYACPPKNQNKVTKSL